MAAPLHRNAAMCTLWLVAALVVMSPSLGLSLELQDLPRHPKDVCGAPEVRTALTICSLSGPTAHCCSGIDAVLANRNSPAAGCLCYPNVLYNVIKEASKFEFDVLKLLGRCRRTFKATVAWAMDPSPTNACPNISAEASVRPVLEQMGDVQLDPAAPVWAWSNLLQAADFMPYPDMVYDIWRGYFTGYPCLKLVYLVLMCIAPLFLTMHHLVLKRCSAVYRKMEPSQQLVTCQHAVYVLVLGLQLVPQSALVIRALFKSWSAQQLVGPEVTVLVGVFLTSHAALYVLEATVRCIIRFSWLLLVHHLLFFALVVLGLWAQNLAVLAIGLVLDWFVVHEVPLYVVLVAYRLKFSVKFTLGALYFACSWYIITRVLQTVLLMYMIIAWAQHPAVKLTAPFIVAVVMCGGFTIVQAYTLVIYKAMAVKLRAAAATAVKSPAKAANKDGLCGPMAGGKDTGAAHCSLTAASKDAMCSPCKDTTGKDTTGTTGAPGCRGDPLLCGLHTSPSVDAALDVDVGSNGAVGKGEDAA